MDDKKEIKVTVKREKINNYTESYESTLNNIHAIAVFMIKQFGRMGYQIKVMEQILEELKKANKGK